MFSKTGVEAAEDEVLQGTSDTLFLTRLRDLFTGKQPKGGAVELTIDAAAQDAAYKGLGKQRGAVVALDPSNGEILAMASTPSYDPNTLAGHDSTKVNKEYQKLDGEAGNPLYNRAIGGDLYPPGSSFKLITAAAALESGQYTKDTVIDAPSTLPLPNSSAVLGNMNGEACSSSGKQTLTQALDVSCNTGFAQVGMNLGQDQLRAQAQAFGFGRDLAVPMAVTPSSIGDNLDQAQTAMSAIGQYDDRVTPLQMAMVVSAIVNGGKIQTPHLVRTQRDADLQVVSTTPNTTWATPISANTASQLKDMMISVVQSGTGTMAQIPGVTVGGKTGTAETGNGEAPDNWFVSFAEAGGRQVAVAVVVENGGTMGRNGTGGAVAGPIAKAVMKAVVSQ
jgi:peptidoglycan glycosyltransferase